MILARYVRLIPLTWSPSGPGLRLNYIGCFSQSNTTSHSTVPFENQLTTKPYGIPTLPHTGTMPINFTPTLPALHTVEPREYQQTLLSSIQIMLKSNISF